MACTPFPQRQALTREQPHTPAVAPCRQKHHGADTHEHTPTLHARGAVLAALR